MDATVLYVPFVWVWLLFPKAILSSSLVIYLRFSSAKCAKFYFIVNFL